MLSWKKRIIDIYIIKEILVPFTAGVAIIGVIMLGSILFQLTQIIFERQIPLASVIRFLAYQIPDITVQTFPMAILFATISGMGRLNRENEFTALRMGGVSLYRLILPLLLLGVVVSGLTFYINEKVVPWSNHQANNIIRYSILKQNMPSVQEDVFFRGPEGRLFYVNKYDDANNRLEEVVVFNLPEKASRYPEIVTASTGRITDNKWQLENGIIHRYDESGDLSLEVQFDKMDYVLAEDMQQFFGEQRTTSEMSRARLKREIDLFARSGIDVDSLLVDYHLKLAMPLTALIFILIGTPLSLSSRDSRSAGIVFTIVTVFLYYIILSVARFLGKSGQLDPLLAAWAPNLVFAFLGIVLLIWRENWQALLARLLPAFLLIFLLLSPAGGEAAGEAAGNAAGEGASTEGVTFSISQADLLSFKKKDGQLQLEGGVIASYNQLHIKADRVIIKGDGGFSSLVDYPDNIVLDRGKVSGCDLEDPHYYLQAEVLTIYPGDHLEARNVVFRELNGRLPLFYWPYLYISLKEKQDRLVPEIGYSASRGWFIKTTYYYWYRDELPGEFYLDYYTVSGFGGGFKQYLLYDSDLKASLYFYAQENETGLPGLFRWEGGIELDDQRGPWKSRTDLDYTEYETYRLFKGNTRISFQNERQNLRVGTVFDSKDYLLTDYNDDQELALDLDYRLDLSRGWELDLSYNRDYLYNPGEELKRRWGSKVYLEKRMRRSDFQILFERFAPRFTEGDEDEEEQVSFYRWPELNYSYYPEGAFDYALSLGRYYEDISGIEGYRGSGRARYNNRWWLSDNTYLKTTQILNGAIYQMSDSEAGRLIPGEGPYLASYQSKYEQKTSFNQYLSWKNSYDFTGYLGNTPFNFDRVRWQERWRSDLNFHYRGFQAQLGGGYDIYQRKYFPISALLKWQINQDWEVGLGGSYNIEAGDFGLLAFTSRYENENWEINTALKYDPEAGLLERVDNRLTYRLAGEWYFESNTGYEYDERLKKANLLLKKNFHCRQLWFGYDFMKKEFSLEYRVNLFPEKGVRFKSSEDTPFEMNIRELLEL